MTTNKLAIIGGSGLYDVEDFKDRKLLDLNIAKTYGWKSKTSLKESIIKTYQNFLKK